MKKVGIYVFFLFAVTTAVGASIQMKETPIPEDRTVEQFESHGEFGLQAILRFGMEAKVPLGLILANDQLCKRRVEITVQKESVATVMGMLTKQLDGYRWIFKDGVLLVEPEPIPQGAVGLLSTVIPHYSTPKTTLAGLGLFLIMDTRGVLRPEMGTAGSLLSSPDAQKVGPLELLNATVEQILNRITMEGTGGEWVLFPTPDDYRNGVDRKFVEIVSYAEDANRIRNVSCAA